MSAGMTLHQLEAELNSFSADTRREALSELAARASRGEIGLPSPGPNANLHVHSFFSYNADGHSPSRIAWEARKAGLFAAGVVEFDVLDGLDEFLSSGDVLGLRTVVGLESRVFVSDYADRDINSPGQAGISYYMGTGFHRLPSHGPAAETLQRMRELARKRNEGVADRVNRFLSPGTARPSGEGGGRPGTARPFGQEGVRIDYERDVLPLTPSGNATERHMLAAYEEIAARVFPVPADRAAYWSEKLGEAGRVTALMRDSVAFRELLRARLMKRGGAGYAAPEEGSFPALEDMIAMIAACGALPCITWLDGTSVGEADPEEVVAFNKAKGALALNIIPDRNWNVDDPEVRERKVANLHAIVEAAQAAGLILVYGTERNKHGQPSADDLGVEALAPIAAPLREGAYAVYGHTAMARHAGRPLSPRAASSGHLSVPTDREGEWCRETFGDDEKKRNAFYAEVGRLLEPGPNAAEKLAAACEADSPDEILSRLRT